MDRSEEFRDAVCPAEQLDRPEVARVDMATRQRVPSPSPRLSRSQLSGAHSPTSARSLNASGSFRRPTDESGRCPMRLGHSTVGMMDLSLDPALEELVDPSKTSTTAFLQLFNKDKLTNRFRYSNDALEIQFLTFLNGWHWGAPAILAGSLTLTWILSLSLHVYTSPQLTPYLALFATLTVLGFLVCAGFWIRFRNLRSHSDEGPKVAESVQVWRERLLLGAMILCFAWQITFIRIEFDCVQAQRYADMSRCASLPLSIALRICFSSLQLPSLRFNKSRIVSGFVFTLWVVRLLVLELVHRSSDPDATSGFWYREILLTGPFMFMWLLSIILKAGLESGARTTFEQWILKLRLSINLRFHQRRVKALVTALLPEDGLTNVANGELFLDYSPSCSLIAARVADYPRWFAQNIPRASMNILDELFTLLDSKAIEHGVEKCFLAGDLYFASVGLRRTQLRQERERLAPVRAPHSQTAIKFAVLMRKLIQQVAAATSRPSSLTSESVAMNTILADVQSPLTLAIAVHSGPASGQFFGTKKWIYTVVGPTEKVVMELVMNAAPAEVLVSQQSLLTSQLEVVRQGEPRTIEGIVANNIESVGRTLPAPETGFRGSEDSIEEGVAAGNASTLFLEQEQDTMEKLNELHAQLYAWYNPTQNGSTISRDSASNDGCSDCFADGNTTPESTTVTDRTDWPGVDSLLMKFSGSLEEQYREWEKEKSTTPGSRLAALLHMMLCAMMLGSAGVEEPLTKSASTGCMIAALLISFTVFCTNNFLCRRRWFLFLDIVQCASYFLGAIGAALLGSGLYSGAGIVQHPFLCFIIVLKAHRLRWVFSAVTILIVSSFGVIINGIPPSSVDCRVTYIFAVAYILGARVWEYQRRRVFWIEVTRRHTDHLLHVECCWYSALLNCLMPPFMIERFADRELTNGTSTPTKSVAGSTAVFIENMAVMDLRFDSFREISGPAGFVHSRHDNNSSSSASSSLFAQEGPQESYEETMDSHQKMGVAQLRRFRRLESILQRMKDRQLIDVLFVVGDAVRFVGPLLQPVDRAGASGSPTAFTNRFLTPDSPPTAFQLPSVGIDNFRDAARSVYCFLSLLKELTSAVGGGISVRSTASVDSTDALPCCIKAALSTESGFYTVMGHREPSFQAAGKAVNVVSSIVENTPTGIGFIALTSRLFNCMKQCRALRYQPRAVGLTSLSAWDEVSQELDITTLPPQSWRLRGAGLLQVIPVQFNAPPVENYEPLGLP
jgi:class 3 adenylate cyclase